MKTNYLIYILLIGIFLIGSIQIFNILYSEDVDFNSLIENQLVSVVQIKGERINDYFLERENDIIFISGTDEIEGLFDYEKNYNPIIEGNMKKKLEIISKQIEIFINKYPEMTLGELQNDNDFRRIVLQSFGENSRFLLVNSETGEIILDKKIENVGRNLNALSGKIYSKNLNLKSKDRISLGLGYEIYEDEFRVIRNVSKDHEDYIGDFNKIGNYLNLLLIDSSGYVVYETGKSFNYGADLDSFASSESYLGKIYSMVKEGKESVISGPYMNENLDGSFDLVLAFARPVLDKGFVILQKRMDDVNEIVLGKSGLGDNGEVYLLNKDGLLLTPLADKDILVQEVTNENSKKCFEKKNIVISLNELISHSYDFEGDQILGTYSYISESDWCLISEFSADEIFKAPKKGRVRMSLGFVIILNLILFFIGFLLVSRLNKRGKRK